MLKQCRRNTTLVKVNETLTDSVKNPPNLFLVIYHYNCINGTIFIHALNVQLYLLQLQQDKYYVGQSDRPIIRYHEHLIGQRSKWTRQYPAIALLKIKTINVLNADEANLYENWTTLHYMEKYGWENVRGGRFLDLEEYRIKDKLKYIYDTEFNHIRYHVGEGNYLIIYLTDQTVTKLS